MFSHAALISDAQCPTIQGLEVKLNGELQNAGTVNSFRIVLGRVGVNVGICNGSSRTYPHGGLPLRPLGPNLQMKDDQQGIIYKGEVAGHQIRVGS